MGNLDENTVVFDIFEDEENVNTSNSNFKRTSENTILGEDNILVLNIFHQNEVGIVPVNVTAFSDRMAIEVVIFYHHNVVLIVNIFDLNFSI